MPNIIEPAVESIKKEIEGSKEVWGLIRTGDLAREYLDELAISLQALSLSGTAIHTQGGATRSNASNLLESMARADAAASFIDLSLKNLMTYSIAGNDVVNRVKNWFTKNIIPWLTNLWKSVWATIQKITTLKEWKISGDIGGHAFGLGGASIEVSFGY